MKRVSRRTHLHSSFLIRTLVELQLVESDTPDANAHEKLSTWISFTDAITLSGIQKVSHAKDTLPSNGADDLSLAQEFYSARQALQQSITYSGTAGNNKLHLALPIMRSGMTVEEASNYMPFRRYHQNCQRHLEQNVRSIRRKVRTGVASFSPSLRQLATIDAVYENLLREREASLLATLPTLLEKRFHQLCKAHQHESPDLWMKPGSWLTEFLRVLHAVLLAELDFRLLPAVGLLEALIPNKD